MACLACLLLVQSKPPSRRTGDSIISCSPKASRSISGESRRAGSLVTQVRLTATPGQASSS